MPKFVSVMGKHYPAKEQVSMKNTFGKTIESDLVVGPDGSHTVKEGETFIYTGPNREAVKILKEMGEDTMGRDFRNDPEFLQSIRNMQYKDTKDYLKAIGFSEKETYDKQMSLIDIISTGDKQKQKEIVELAGGKDFSGNKANDTIGGFGTERLRSPEELTKSNK